MPRGVYERKKTDDIDRFLSKVQKTDSCWLWMGCKDPNGYGRFHFSGRGVLAHRWSYVHVRGDIPDGLEMDHICRNRACVNPDHLEAVTGAENTRRGDAGKHMREKSVSVTHCPQGHEYTTENTRISKAGCRNCRECARARCREGYRQNSEDRKAYTRQYYQDVVKPKRESKIQTGVMI